MADFIPSKKLPSDFNKGNKYKSGDAVQAKTVNDLIESALWVQELAFGDITFLGDAVKEVVVSANKNDSVYEWKTTSDSKNCVYISQTNHGFTTINSVNAERIITASDGKQHVENMFYALKYYKSGSISVIVDNKIDMRIIIKGEK